MTQLLPDRVSQRDAARPVDSVAAVPGWLLSGGLHAVVLAILITSGLPSCGTGELGSSGRDEGLRDVGIFVKPAATPNDNASETKNLQAEPVAATTPSTAATTDVPSPVPREADAVANALTSMPAVEMPSVIGIGSPKPGASPAISVPVPGSVMQDGGVMAPSRGGGPGEVSFMGIKSTAEKIVFVIDSSSSMGDDNAIAFAKSQLTRSIYRLDKSQQFQVIDFNNIPHFMKLHGTRKFSLYRADEHNKQLAVRHVSTIQATKGTDTMAAISRAFVLKPDVIYFLTDGDEDLTGANVDVIVTDLNAARRTAIHCIKFGRGPDQQPAWKNFPQLLAAKSRGSYVYQDVLKVGRP